MKEKRLIILYLTGLLLLLGMGMGYALKFMKTTKMMIYENN